MANIDQTYSLEINMPCDGKLDLDKLDLDKLYNIIDEISQSEPDYQQIIKQLHYS